MTGSEKHFDVSAGNGRVSAVRHGSGESPYVFTCHGFGSDKSGSYKKLCSALAAAGFTAVRFDFRGNGNSSMSFGGSTVSTRLEDLKSVVEYFNPDRYGVYGSSFGGRIAALHQARDFELNSCLESARRA